jgi:hypothetical protein
MRASRFSLELKSWSTGPLLLGRQHMSDEAVGELVFLVEHTDHLVFLNDEHGAIFSRPATRVFSDWPAPRE